MKILTIICLIGMIGAVGLQGQELTIDVDEVIGYFGQQVEIPVYMTNTSDTIKAFEMWFMLEKPGMVEFDDQAPIISSGTLIDSWSVLGQSLSGQWYDLNVTAGAPHLDPGILPQSGSNPLFIIRANVYESPDLLDGNVLGVYIQADNLDNFSFSDPNGKSIGIVTDTIYDSTCFACDFWAGEECLSWSIVPCDGVYDSVFCCDTLLFAHLDTNYVDISHGSITVALCGDANNSGSINIIDITHMLTCLYGDPLPGDCELIDVNCSGTGNILDITTLIAYLYQGGPEPCCY